MQAIYKKITYRLFYTIYTLKIKYVIFKKHRRAIKHNTIRSERLLRKMA